MNSFLGIDGNSQTEIKNEFGSKTGNIMTLRSIDSYTDSFFFFLSQLQESLIATNIEKKMFTLFFTIRS